MKKVNNDNRDKQVLRIIIIIAIIILILLLCVKCATIVNDIYFKPLGTTEGLGVDPETEAGELPTLTESNKCEIIEDEDEETRSEGTPQPGQVGSNGQARQLNNGQNGQRGRKPNAGLTGGQGDQIGSSPQSSKQSGKAHAYTKLPTHGGDYIIVVPTASSYQGGNQTSGATSAPNPSQETEPGNLQPLPDDQGIELPVVSIP